MRSRVRAGVVAAAMGAGLVLGGGAAVAAPAGQEAGAVSARVMDYWQYHGHYQHLSECVAVGESYLYPTHPGGSDDYECVAKNGGWDLYLIFLT
ncbi:hypothetical protein GCM10027168_06250 [Streptomyces capparidis]